MLEWRFDPTSEAALRIADDDLQVIVLCQEGYTSSLAAAALQDVGVRRGDRRRRRVRRVGRRRGGSPVGRPGQRLVTRSRAG